MKYIKPFLLITESTTFESEYAQKYKPEGYNLIARNESYWGWEYDTSYKYAFLYMNDAGLLILKIINVHIKSGIGAGTRVSSLFEGKVGNINKPDIKTIQENLKKFGHDKSRAGWPFSRNNWMSVYSEEKMTLGDILKDPKTSRMAKVANILKDETTIKNKPEASGENREKISFIYNNLDKLDNLSDVELDDIISKLK
jgi:hypothetical protein